MTRKLIRCSAAAAMLGSLVAATPVFAEDAVPRSQSPQAQHNMGEHGGMMNMMGQMSADHMKQMTEIAENCNRMMSTHTGADNQQVPCRRE